MWDTPAAVDREEGILYINPKRWFELTPFQRKFVKFHEYGHYYLQTDSEEEADAYAFDKLAGTEFQSLKQCIQCLETILDPTRIGHKVRIEALISRALQWDKEHPMKKINKATQSNRAEEIQAMTQLIAAQGQTINNSEQIRANEEASKKNTQYLMIGMMVIAGLFILKN